MIDIELDNVRGCTVSSRVVDNDIVFLPIDVEEIIQIVEDLRSTNSVGFDGLKISCLKKSIEIVAPRIVRIVNQSFRQCKVPNCMKMARIVPRFKSGSPTDETNYRPIAFLLLSLKILERIVLVRLFKFLDLNSPLFTRQYGFVKNSNTTCTLFDFIVRVQKSLDANLTTGGLFIDFYW
jgi:hypothetical protein